VSEESIKIGAKSEENVVCSNCQKSIPYAEAYCFQGKNNEDIYFCAECKEAIDNALRQETANPNYLGAVVLGLLAGAIGGLLWFAIEIFTGYQIGYVAIGLGYLVSKAVIFGSGKKRGLPLQIISATIALLAVLGASYCSLVYNFNDYFRKEIAAFAGVGSIPYIWLSPFDRDVLEALISPMGLVIWGMALYVAFLTPRARKL